MGIGIVEKLQQEFDLEVEWVGYELRPDTPPEGKLLREMFTNYNPDVMIGNMNRAAAPYGIEFKPYDVMANTRLALEASELARDKGLYDQAHKRLLAAYFQENEDIGQKETLLRLMDEIGLDPQELSQAWDDGSYTPRLLEARERGQKYDVMSLPTFVINDQEKIVGARPYEFFKQTLEQL